MRLRTILSAVALAAASAAGAQTVELNVISRVQVEDAGNEVLVSIKGSKPPNFTTFSMMDPPRFVIDVSESTFQNVPEDVTGAGGLIQVVKNLSYGSEATSIARIMIAFTKEVDPPDVQTTGTELVVRIAKPAEMGVARAAPAQPRAAPAATAAAPAATAAAPAAAPAATPAAPAAAPAAGAAATAAAEQARLEREEQARFEAKARADAEAQAKAEVESELRAQAELEARAKAEAEALARAQQEQDRAKVAEQAQAVAAAQAQAKAAAADEARTAREAEAQARLDAKARAEEEKRQKAEEAKARREAEAQAKADARARAAEEKRQKAEEAKARREAEAQARADAKARAAEEKRQRAEGAKALKVASLPPPSEPRTESLAPTGAPNQVREVGFQQLPGASRVYVRTAQEPRFTILEAGENLIRVELANTRVKRRNDTRFMDTSFFPSAVALVTPRREGSTYVVEIKLKERVPYQQKVEGDMLAIDFQRPAGLSAPPGQPASGAPAPGEPAPAESAPGEPPPGETAPPGDR